MRYCGQVLPRPLTFNSTSVSLTFSSDATASGRGFLATYTTSSTETEAPKCSSLFNTVKGDISYERKAVACDQWTYIISLPSSFQLSYKYSGAMQGKVSLYTNKLLHTYQHLTPAIATKTTSNTLKIVVDSAKSSDSFHLSWKSMDKGVCGGFHRVTRATNHIFSHNSYNTTSLAPFQTCVWHLSSRHRVRLTAISFDLVDSPSISSYSVARRARSRGRGKTRRNSARVCGMNFLEVLDGGRRIGRFCNDRKLSVFSSKTSTVKLKLVTQSDNPGKGFHIKFSRLT